MLVRRISRFANICGSMLLVFMLLTMALLFTIAAISQKLPGPLMH